MGGYVLSADADADLEEIWEYIAGDSEWGISVKTSRLIQQSSGRWAIT
jgi:plasmid stabilization system protein ParE